MIQIVDNETMMSDYICHPPLIAVTHILRENERQID